MRLNTCCGDSGSAPRITTLLPWVGAKGLVAVGKEEEQQEAQRHGNKSQIKACS